MCQLCSPDWVFRLDDRFTARVGDDDGTAVDVRAGDAREVVRDAGRRLLAVSAGRPHAPRPACAN